jgi:hypothetical protein
MVMSEVKQMTAQFNAVASSNHSCFQYDVQEVLAHPGAAGLTRRW